MSKIEEKLKHLQKVKEAALSCVHCGQCRVANWPEKGFYYICPVYNTDITPKFEPYFARGKNIILKGLFWGDLELSNELSEIIFQCSLCGACQEFCHDAHNPNIDFANGRWMAQVDVFEALRADLVNNGFGLDSHKSMNDAMVQLLNPYGRKNVQKAEWMDELDFEIKDASKEKCDILYFVGCTAALTPQIQEVAVATAKILNHLNINFSVFGENEVCCGSVAKRTGDIKSFNNVLEMNVELFKKSGVNTIITSCAGCYHTLKKDYGNHLEGIEILHTIEFLDKFIEENDIKLKKLDYETTYHDPCHIGRHMGLYDIPRNILSKISTLNEMQTIREAALCCGAGGGVKKGYPELSLEMAINRVNEAEKTSAKLLVSTCPFCYRNLSDAIEATESSLKMVDLVNLLWDALN